MAYVDDVASIQKALGNIDILVTGLRGDLTAAQGKAAVLEADKAALVKANADLQAYNTQLLADKSTLTAVNAQLVTRVAELQKQIDALTINVRWTPANINTGFIAPPVGDKYVPYQSLAAPGDTLREVAEKVPAGKILTLPEGIFEVSDYADTQNGNAFAALRLSPRTITPRGSQAVGIIGSGRKTIMRLKPGSSTHAQVTNSAKNCPYFLMVQGIPGAIFANFTIEGPGLSQNHWSHGMTLYNCPGAQVSNLYLRGASIGAGNSPETGETFGLNLYKSNDVVVQDTEIDGRDATTGTRVSASPVGNNSCSNPTYKRCYMHHSKAGMPAFWQVTNLTTEDLVTYSNGSGSGSLSGSGINHERVSGTITHIRPTLKCAGVFATDDPNRTGNNGLHISNSSDQSDNILIITDPIIDRGPNGVLGVAVWNPYIGVTDKVVTPPKVTLNGVQLQVRKRYDPGWDYQLDPTKHVVIY